MKFYKADPNLHMNISIFFLIELLKQLGILSIFKLLINKRYEIARSAEKGYEYLTFADAGKLFYLKGLNELVEFCKGQENVANVCNINIDYD